MKTTSDPHNDRIDKFLKQQAKILLVVPRLGGKGSTTQRLSTNQTHHLYSMLLVYANKYVRCHPHEWTDCDMLTWCSKFLVVLLSLLISLEHRIFLIKKKTRFSFPLIDPLPLSAAQILLRRDKVTTTATTTTTVTTWQLYLFICAWSHMFSWAFPLWKRCS